MFTDPLTTVLQLGLKEGMTVADFGTGSGHYAICAAHIVGNTGRVYAVDVQQDVLSRLEKEAKERNLPIETMWADVEHASATMLRDASMDAVVLSNVLFQVRHHAHVLQEAKRVLKKGGKILVVDWSGGFGGIGPHQDHVLSKERAEELLAAAGFTKVKDAQAGPHHYAFVGAAS